jgi:hypothetical protein
VAAADARVGGWHGDVVVALRTVRRRLKDYAAPASGVAAAPNCAANSRGSRSRPS